MFERNDGKGINAIQNKFTAMLKTALHNRRIDYIIGRNRIIIREIPLTDYTEIIGEDEYSAKVEHPDRFELNSATAQNEQSNRQN